MKIEENWANDRSLRNSADDDVDGWLLPFNEHNLDPDSEELFDPTVYFSSDTILFEHFIPNTLHKTLYHTLFESHMGYGITVWGGISDNKLKNIFTVQKHCTRVLFGDKEAYLDKFKTSARSRRFGTQTLGQEFYEREHTKPLFTKHGVMTVHNLYKYQTITNTYNILKFRTPISLTLFTCFNISSRKDTLLLTPFISECFIYNASSLWNIFRTCPEGSEITDFTKGVGHFKSKIRALIFRRQSMGDQHLFPRVIINWHLADERDVGAATPDNAWTMQRLPQMTVQLTSNPRSRQTGTGNIFDGNSSAVGQLWHLLSPHNPYKRWEKVYESLR